MQLVTPRLVAIAVRIAIIKKIIQLTQKYLHELLLFHIFVAELAVTDAKIFA